jgi:hypothetical protein
VREGKQSSASREGQAKQSNASRVWRGASKAEGKTRERRATALPNREILERERGKPPHQDGEGHMGCLGGWASPFVTPFFFFFPFLFYSTTALS